MIFRIPLFALVYVLVWSDVVFATPVEEVNKARREGWEFAAITVRLLREGNNAELPGIRAWLADYAPVEKSVAATKAPATLPAIDADALLTHNPNFWSMFYDIAPGDPALALLHAGLLLAGGEAQRASHIATFARQRPGIEQIMQQALTSVAISAMSAQKPSLELVQEGVKLHDAGDFAGALRKYDEALALLPANGWAHYERGFTLRVQALKAAGQPAPSNDSVTLGQLATDPPEVRAAFAQARQHDPFQYQAWQGDDPAIIRGVRALMSRAQPVWESIRSDASQFVTNQQLTDLAEACRTAHIDDYALALRQVVVARRRGYSASDHAFIAECLHRLSSGDVIAAIVEKLYQDSFPARRLAPINGEAAALTAPKPPRP